MTKLGTEPILQILIINNSNLNVIDFDVEYGPN